MTIDLPNPPGYDYRTCGPWFVGHEHDGRAKAWIVHALESAVVRFWRYEQDQPDRRFITDARGVMILGINNEPDATPMMVGIREAMDTTLRLAEESGLLNTEQAVDILTMAEAIRSRDGAAL